MTFSKIIIFLLFCVSIAYIGIISTTVIHEVFGHGLAAQISGHDFTRFVIHPDGFGWAEYTYNHDVTPKEEIFIFLAGPISTCIVAVILLILGIIFRKNLWWSVAFIILGMINFTDSGPYMLWDSINPVPPGDFGRVLALIPEYRLLFIMIGGVLSIFGIFIINIFIYKALFKWFGDFSNHKWKVIVFMFFGESAGWFTYDWNQLSPGVNYWPQIFSTIVTLISLIYIGTTNQKPKNLMSLTTSWKIPLTIVILGAILAASLTLFWFQNGVII